MEARSPSGPAEIQADLVVACDGRHSAVRAASQLEMQEFGVPIDVLWFHISRPPGDPAAPIAVETAGVVSHYAIDLELRVDFKFKTLAGSVTLDLKRLDPRATQLVLDTKGLMILDVTQKATDVLGATDKSQTTWVSRPFHLEKPDPILGSALVIDLPPSKRGTESIKIDYETTEASSALQWLTEKQTSRHKPLPNIFDI